MSGRIEAALRELERALAADPGHAMTHAEVALCRSALGDHEAALAAADRAVGCAPKDSFAHYARGWVLMMSGRHAEAVESANESMRLAPAYVGAVRLLAYVRSDLGLHDGAAQAAAEMGRLDPDSAQTHLCRSYVLRAAGRTAEARAAAEGALASSPDEFSPHLELAYTAEQQRDWNAAAQAYGEALRLRPGDACARSGLLRMLRIRNPVFRTLEAAEHRWWSLDERWRTALIVGLCVGTCGAFALLLLGWLAARFVGGGRVADPLMDVVLRFDRHGRHLLGPWEILLSDRLACMALGLTALVVTLVLGAPGVWCVAAPLLAMMVLAVSWVTNCRPGWPRVRMAGYLAVVAALGAGAVLAAPHAVWDTAPGRKLDDAAGATIWLTGLSAAGFLFGPGVARRFGYPWSHRFDLTPRAA
jgi:tetratricopeptide (TPR) repeat protein